MRKHHFFVLSAIRDRVHLSKIIGWRARSMCHVDELVYTCSFLYNLFTYILFFFYACPLSGVRHPLLLLQGEVLSSPSLCLWRVEILYEQGETQQVSSFFFFSSRAVRRRLHGRWVAWVARTLLLSSVRALATHTSHTPHLYQLLSIHQTEWWRRRKEERKKRTIVLKGEEEEEKKNVISISSSSSSFPSIVFHQQCSRGSGSGGRRSDEFTIATTDERSFVLFSLPVQLKNTSKEKATTATRKAVWLLSPCTYSPSIFSLSLSFAYSLDSFSAVLDKSPMLSTWSIRSN